MTPAQVRRELAQLTTNRAQLETRRAQYAVALEVALTSDHYDGNIVAGLRADLAHAVTRLRDLDERYALLAAKRPTPAHVQQAEQEIATLLRAISEATAAFDAATARHGGALDIAEGTARHLAQCRAVCRETVAAIIEVADAAWVVVDVPPYPALTPAVEQLYHLQAVLLGEAAFGEPNEVTLRNLAAARAVASGAVGAAV